MGVSVRTSRARVFAWLSMCGVSAGSLFSACGGQNTVDAPRSSESPGSTKERSPLSSPSENQPISAAKPEARVHEPGRPMGSEDLSSPEGAHVSWCSSGGAPIVGQPVLDEKERAYVSTADGYLHAFERDGRFRWSYTVKGTPLGSVSLRPGDGAILIGTTSSDIYAITQEGRLYFNFKTLSPVWSGLFALNPETVVFLGKDSRLYALATNGMPRYRVRAPGEPMGGPVVAEKDVVWVPLTDGLARFESAMKLEKIPLPAPVEEVVPVGAGAVARAGGKAYLVQIGKERRELGEAEFLVSSARGFATIHSGEFTPYNAEAVPEEQDKLRLPHFDTISAAPAVSGGDLWVPYEDGTLRVVSLKPKNAAGDPEILAEIVVGKSPLATPVVGVSGTWALAPTLGGEFCAVRTAARAARNSKH